MKNPAELAEFRSRSDDKTLICVDLRALRENPEWSLLFCDLHIIILCLKASVKLLMLIVEADISARDKCIFYVV